MWGTNNTVQASTKSSPADLLFAYTGGTVIGDLAKANSDQGDSDSKQGSQAQRRVEQRRTAAKIHLDKVAKRMTARFNQRRRVAIQYKKGDLVLWRRTATSSTLKGVNSKLANKYDGPYKISKVLEGDRYVITAVKGVRGYKNFKTIAAVDALRRYKSAPVELASLAETSCNTVGVELDP